MEAIKKFFKKKIKMHWSAAIFAAALMCFFILLSAVAIQPGEFAGTLKNFMAVPVLWLLNAVPIIVLFGIVWAACGFGLSGLDIMLFHTPLWVIGGTIGTWICSIVVVVVLAKRFFVGFDLDEDEGVGEGEARV